jgi:hypothetical protein
MTAWSRERPTQPGWYWIRYDNNPRPCVCHVVLFDDGDTKGERFWVDLDGESKVPIDAYDEHYTWQGPLEPKE